MAGVIANRVWASLLVAACGQQSTAPPPVRDAGAGEALYQRACSPCHGDDGKGYKADHAPSLVTSTFLESASDEFLRNSIALGRPGTSMAAYGKQLGGPLDVAAIGQLVTWIRGHGPQPIALPPVGPGDIQRGATLYAQDCLKCHGSHDQRGDAVLLANAQFLRSASNAYIRWAIVHGRPGTPMESWQAKLTDPQIDDLVAYVRAFEQPGKQESRLPPPTGHEPLVLNPKGAAPSFTVRHEDRAYVPIDQAAKQLAAGKRMIIIDARPTSEWQRVHITGAVSIPYMDLDKLDVLPRDGTWILPYCACPHHLSGVVADALTKRGYQHVAVLDEGINEWFRRGYPVVAAAGVEPPPAEMAHPLQRPIVGTPR
ncbi:MAG TPA: c-type cytochrome [Kofleriaceae bacterium]